MAQHSDPLEALRQVADFLDLLADQARATSQAIHDAIPDQVDLASGDLGLCQDCLALVPYDLSTDGEGGCPRCGGDVCACDACMEDR